MADNNINDETEDLLNEIFSDVSEEEDTLENENSELFSMLGMSEEEIEKAAKDLQQETNSTKTMNSSLKPFQNAQSEQKADSENSSFADVDAEISDRASSIAEEYSMNSAESGVENTVPEMVASNMENDFVKIEEETLADSEKQKTDNKEEKKRKKQLAAEKKKAEKLAKKEAKLAKKAQKTKNKSKKKNTVISQEAQLKPNEPDKDIDSEEETAGSLVADSIISNKEANTDANKEDDSFENKSMQDTVSSIPSEQNEKMSLGKKLSLAFFGPEEPEDLPTPEELAKKATKKEEKAKKKEEKQQKKEAKKEENKIKKEKSKEMAVVKKAAKKDKQAQIRLQEEEEDAKEKKISRGSVAFTALVLVLLCGIVLAGTSIFNYKTVIMRANNYFNAQKYKLAYEQIAGVDIKKNDQKLSDKIYCVMYVQQQLDSYNNFCQLGMYDYALDSLIKGLKKYNLHYEEAQTLGVNAQLEGLKLQIETELSKQYQLTEETVSQWMSFDKAKYYKTVCDYVASLQLDSEHVSSETVQAQALEKND